jgi:hypothetical protein
MGVRRSVGAGRVGRPSRTPRSSSWPRTQRRGSAAGHRTRCGRRPHGRDRGEVLLMGPSGVAGVVGQAGGGLGDPGRLQRCGQVGQLLECLGRVALRLGIIRASMKRECAQVITSTGSSVLDPSSSGIFLGENHRSHCAASPGNQINRSAGSTGRCSGRSRRTLSRNHGSTRSSRPARRSPWPACPASWSTDAAPMARTA